MFGFLRPRSTPTASDAGRLLAQAGKDDARARKRAMVDQLRADLRAKGYDMPPIDWSAL